MQAWHAKYSKCRPIRQKIRPSSKRIRRYKNWRQVNHRDNMPRLTAIILTYNESEHIQACLESVKFADSRRVFDSGSTDNTVQLAKESGADVIQRDFDHYAGQRNAALDSVTESADWVLFVDADERVTPELA